MKLSNQNINIVQFSDLESSLPKKKLSIKVNVPFLWLIIEVVVVDTDSPFFITMAMNSKTVIIPTPSLRHLIRPQHPVPLSLILKQRITKKKSVLFLLLIELSGRPTSQNHVFFFFFFLQQRFNNLKNPSYFLQIFIFVPCFSFFFFYIWSYIIKSLNLTTLQFALSFFNTKKVGLISS